MNSPAPIAVKLAKCPILKLSSTLHTTTAMEVKVILKKFIKAAQIKTNNISRRISLEHVGQEGTNKSVVCQIIVLFL